MKTRINIKRGWKRTVAAVLVGAGLLSVPAQGAGLLVAEGGFGGILEMIEHDVDVVINNGVAVTRVTQVFRNTEKRQVEALYTFPVPKGASVANFSMWINGKEMVGEVLEKKRARQIYNSYKRKKRDPGLLEQVDYKTFEMRIFPIAAGAEQKVEITYYQEMDFDHDWITYVYPLATTTRENIDARIAGKFAISVKVKSAVPIIEMSSPSHGEEFVVAKHTKQYAEASLEASDGSLARDVVVACRMSRPHTGIDLVTSAPPGEDGYFMMTLTAGDDLGKLDEGMDYVFVLDISGSMGDDGKLLTSKKSIASFMRELDPEDRFDVLTFNVRASTLFNAMREATPEALDSAEQFLDSQRARGGTVLKPALDAAYRYADPDRPLNVVILSDGMTEQQERRKLLELLNQRPRNARVFCIGVGNDVNRPLLQEIADDTGGLASFISRGDNFARQAKAFRQKLLRPVASQLAVDFQGIDVYNVEPKQLPALYYGAPVRLYGRYRRGGPCRINVSGDVRGREFKQSATLGFPKRNQDNPEIERMWAWHRIQGLQRRINRSGSRPEWTRAMVDLGEMYSIVTEYTSFLVLENDAEYRRWKIERRNAARMTRDRNAQKKRREMLTTLRDKASTDLGPQAVATARNQAHKTVRSTPGSRRPASAPPRAQPTTSTKGNGVDLDFGTGPIGPLFIGLLAWLKRKARHVKAV